MGEAKYGEPWAWEDTEDEIEVEETGDSEPGYRVLDCYGDGVLEATSTNLTAPYRGYAERAVSCVNALAGVSSPSEYREAVAELIRAARDVLGFAHAETGYQRNRCDALSAALERVEGEGN